MIKVDLHTHSTDSPDGGITADQYRDTLASGLLDCIAITDHGKISLAQELHDELGDKIIVGEEIMTKVGEVIGLFLQKPVLGGLGLKETIRIIKDQSGIVYIPHPFETIRKGLHPAELESVDGMIDIIEVCNGRAFFQNRSQQAVVWAKLNHVPGAASSDAHGIRGLGKTYTGLKKMPTRDSITELIKQPNLITEKPSMRSMMYPKYYTLKKRLSR
ncbi:PHP domain-containing protein [soil metagenome]